LYLSPFQAQALYSHGEDAAHASAEAVRAVARRPAMVRSLLAEARKAQAAQGGGGGSAAAAVVGGGGGSAAAAVVAAAATHAATHAATGRSFPAPSDAVVQEAAQVRCA
jgi:hypothetical protein